MLVPVVIPGFPYVSVLGKGLLLLRILEHGGVLALAITRFGLRTLWPFFLVYSMSIVLSVSCFNLIGRLTGIFPMSSAEAAVIERKKTVSRAVL